MFKGKKLFRGASLAALLIFTFTFLIGPNVASAATVAVEVVRYTGDTQVDAPNFEADLKAALTKLGVDASQVKFTDANKTEVNATDSFNWTVYDHTGNWGEDPYPNGDQNPAGGEQNRHIIIKNGGKNITFYGYGRPSYKDFMLMANKDPGKKTFTFELNEANIKYHSMEGGGFLFNSQIVEGVLSGYAIIFDQGGMELYQITGVNADAFHNTENAQMRQINGITLLKTFSKNGAKNHSIKIEVTPQNLDLWDNSNHTIDAYALPQAYGNGFGPIATHNPHNCNELSYFTFNNLRMSMTTTISLADVIKSAKWSSCSNRYIVNLQDTAVPDFNNADTLKQILSKMAADKAYYIGWGTEANQQQALEFVEQNGNRGAFVANNDYVKSVDAIALNIANQLKADVAAAKAAITPSVSKGESLTDVTKNLTLPTKGVNCTAISWSSSSQSVLSNTGFVNRSEEGDVTVTLTAAITKGGITDTKQFKVTVKKKEVLVKTGSALNTWTLSLMGLLFISVGLLSLRSKNNPL